MTISLLILYSLLYYFSLFIDWVDQATLGAHILLEWANDSLTRASIHFRQSSIVRSLYRITTSEYSMFLPLFGVLAYIVCHFSKTLLDHYTNQWLGFFSGLMQDHLSDACDTALGIAPRYARTYSENLFYWQCSGERSGVAHRAELWTTLIVSGALWCTFWIRWLMIPSRTFGELRSIRFL